MWSDRIEETERLRELHRMGGGQERIDRQHAKGKMTALERVEYLLDEGSFHPLESLFQTREDSASLQKEVFPGDGVVTGWGTIHGRSVCVASEDFTVVGGTLGEVHAQKICELQDLALDMRVPLILLNDSGGARIEEGILSLSGYGGMFSRHVRASGVIPQIAAILGPCSGGASYSPALCDFVFMVKDLSKMCLTGPAVVESVLGIRTTLDELGSTEVHGKKSGVAHVVCEDERSCLDGIRTLLTYLPQNASEEAAAELGRLHREADVQMGVAEEAYGTVRGQSEGTGRERGETAGLLGKGNSNREEDGHCHELHDILRNQRRPVAARPFEEIVPDNARHAYDVHAVITNILQNESFYEIHREFAPNAVVGFGIFDGGVLGIVANQPMYMGGAIDYDAADKMARFIRFCDCFRIPLLTLVDVPAFFPGPKQEQSGIIRHGAKLLYAYSEATVPKVTLIMRKAYGGAFIAMNCKMMSADVVYAWPIAEIAVMGAEGAVRIIDRRRIEGAADPQQEYERCKQAYENQFSNPFIAAKKGYVDEIILPGETTERLRGTFRLLAGKEQRTEAYRKHGNIPL